MSKLSLAASIGWRRVSDGDPCAFCAMLVTRGPVYTSRDKALHTTNPAPGIPAGTLHKYHPHCGCTVEIVYDDWQPTEQEQQWIDDYYRAAESLPARTPRTAKTVLPILRRNGSFRDSATRRGTPEYLAERRRLRFKRKTEALSPKTGQPKQKEPPAAIEWPDNVQAPDDTVVNHILHGEGDGKRGGHLYGTNIEGKTEFPESWDQARVIDAIRQVMENPDWVAPPPNPRAMYLFGKTIDGVQVEVGAYLVDGWKYVIDRAYPRGGVGVTRNVKGRKIDLPPSKGKHWRRN